MLQRDIQKRIEALEARLGGELIFKYWDEDGTEHEATFEEFMKLKKKGHYTTYNGQEVWDTGFPKFKICGGNKGGQLTDLLNAITDEIGGVI